MTFIAAPISRTHADRLRARGIGSNILDYTLFWPGIWLACALGAGIRSIGVLFVVFPVLLCFAYAALQRVVPPRLLALYVVWCLLAGAASFFQWFPTSWQSHFMAEAIARQLMPTIGFFAVAWASKAYFRKAIRSGNIFATSAIALVLSSAVSLIFAIVLHLGYEGHYSIYDHVATFGSFVNNTLIAGFFVTGYMYLTRGWRRYAAITVVVGIALITHFIQFRLWAAVALLLLWGAPARKTVIAVTALLIGAYAVAVNFGPQLMAKDPNDGLRVVMLRDALSSVVDTDGIGIGYGKESVKARYQFPGMPDFTFLPDWKSMTRERMLQALSSSVENSYVMTLLRTGVIGLALLVAAIFTAFPPRGLPPDTRKHAAALFAMSFIASFVNAGFDTPLQVVGHGFIYGYLLALLAYRKSLIRVNRVLQASASTVDAGANAAVPSE